MNVWGNLFVKIFIGFWLVTLTILASWTLTSDYFDSRPTGPPRHGKPTGPPPRFILRTIYKLQNLEQKALAEAVAQIREEHDVEIYLLDSSGADLLGRVVPEDVTRTAEQLKGGRRRAFLKTPTGRLVGHQIYRREQGPLRAVIVFQEPQLGILNILGASPWLRVGLAVFISGLVCFALSRLMTNRLKALQLASRHLANGDLNTRLQVRDQGGDETDELARDFNTMAGQLQDRMQNQKRLLSDVSHELRSPLARLRIALALAQAQPRDSDTRSDKYLSRIEQEAERLEELIGQLLSSQALNIDLDSHIDVVSLLTQLCVDANFEGQEQGKQVAFSPVPEQAIVDSSGDLLHKSFENILRNALAHTADNSVVRVDLVSTPQEIRVSIEDRGPGIPANELGNIFDEFYRVDTARTRESGGYGLGLAIARRAILQHRGQIAAENTGTGLKIIVRLPLHS